MKLRQFSQSTVVSVVVFILGLVMFSGSLALALLVITRHVQGDGAHALSGDIAWQLFDGGMTEGNNASESTISISNVANLAKLWETATPNVVDGAIVEQPNVSTSQGTVDLVIANTVKGNLVAYNASNGSKIWEADPSSTNYNGQGTKSTPAVDPSGNYVYAYALDGYIHKYNIGNGVEAVGTGFPAQVTLLANNIEKGSAGINIASGYLYMTLSGNDGDYGHYVGHVVAVNLSTGAKTVWNAECSNITQLLDANSGDANYCADSMSGIWSRPGVRVDPVTGNVFVATGNGKYNASTGGNDWGDSLLELKPDLSRVVDSYTPSNYATLDSADEDLGSTEPVLLPTQLGSNTPYMLVQAGKDDKVRLINRANMSGSGGPGHVGGEMQTLSISAEVHDEPGEWVDGGGNVWVFVTDESDNLYAYKLVTTSGVSSLVQQYHKTGIAKTSPFVANGVMYLDGTSSILALNPSTGATLFNSSSISVGSSEHWNSPVVVNGVLFTPDDNGNLLALDVPGATSSQNIPVYRLANWKTHERLFTTSQVEVNNAIADYPGWVSEGIGFYSVPASTFGVIPVYRLANWRTHERLFTISSTEVSSAITDYQGWVSEGTGFYSVASTDPGAIPVYRLANWKTHERLFTTSQVEVNNAIADYPGWVSEGIGFYSVPATGP